MTQEIAFPFEKVEKQLLQLVPKEEIAAFQFPLVTGEERRREWVHFCGG